ncbi:MAG: hypothetical protein WA364_09185 [Candidatus Nitrosopolaris sp.]
MPSLKIDIAEGLEGNTGMSIASITYLITVHDIKLIYYEIYEFVVASKTSLAVAVIGIAAVLLLVTATLMTNHEVFAYKYCHGKHCYGKHGGCHKRCIISCGPGGCHKRCIISCGPRR